MKSSFKSMFKYIIKQEKVVPYLIFITISAILVSVFSLILPLIVGYLVDNIIGDSNPNHLYAWLFVAIVITVIFKLFYMFFPNYLTFKFEILISQAISEHLLTRYFSYKGYNYKKHNTGKLLNILNNDTSAVTGIIFQVVSISISSVIAIGGYFVILFLVSPVIALIIGAGVPFYFVAIFINNKRLQEIQIKQATDYDAYLTATKNILSQKLQINQQRAENHFMRQFKHPYDTFIQTRLKYWFWFFMSTELPLMVSMILKYFALFVGAYHVFDNRMSLGTLLIIAAYVESLTIPLNEIAHIIIRKNSNQVSFDRCGEFFIQKEDIDSFALFPNNAKNFLTACAVTITGKDGISLFHIDSLTIATTGLYQLIGENGSGKTSFLELICNISHSKDIVLKEENSDFQLNKALFSDLAFHFSPYLFADGTVEENILLCKEKTAQFDEIIALLNIDFLNKTIAMDDVGLSLGQQAKVALARALLSGNKVMIFDEPVANLDTETATAFAKHLAKIKHDHLIIIVSHDNIFTNHRDAVLLIENNQMVQR